MNTKLKNTLTHCGLVLVCFIVAAIYFSPVFQGKTLPQGDTVKFKAMVKENMDFSEATGERTNWNSSMFSGMPNYQIGGGMHDNSAIQWMKNLFSLKFFNENFPNSIGILFLYLLGFYICLVVLGINPWLSLLGALAFGLGSYNIIIIEAGHITKAYALACMPPILAGLMLAFRKKYVAGGVLFALALALQIRFNHLQITYYTALACGVIAITCLVYAIKGKELKSYLKGVGMLAAAAVLAVSANAYMLLSTQGYAKYTKRGGSEISVTPHDLYNDNEPKSISGKTEGLDIDYAFSWSYGKAETFTLLVPGFNGGGSNEPVSKESESYKAFHQTSMPLYWGDQPFTSGPVYFGAIIVFLFVLGMFVVKGPERWWLLILTLIAIIMSWGKNLMGINQFLFEHLPLYNKFRTPSMSLVIANVTMVLMAVFALKAILDKKTDKAELKKALYWATGITGGLCLLFIIFAGSFSYSGLSDTQMAAQYGDQWQSIQDIFIADRKALLVADSWRSLAFILIAAVVLWLYNQDKLKNKGIVIALLACLVVIDLWGVDKRYLNEKSFVRARETALQPAPYDAQIDAQAEYFHDKDYRMYNVAVNTFNDSQPSAFHHQIGGYHAAKLRRYQDLIDFYMLRHLNQGVLDMLNARYIVGRTSDGNTVAQRRPSALGNAWFVNHCQVVNDANAEILALNTLAVADTAVVDKRFASFVESKDLSRDSSSRITPIHQTPYHPGYLKYETNTNKEQLAVFSEIYYAPDWRAYIDGKPAEYFRVNYILRAMVIPAGKHVIEFKNEAPSYKPLNAVTIAGSVTLLLASLAGILFCLRKKEDESNVEKTK